MDKIFIDSLEIFAKHGVLKEENALGQKFIVSAVLECDTRAAGMSDMLEKSVNYADVCELIEKVMSDNTYRLIEAAAEKIAESILLAYNMVKRVTINLKKPWAPILMNVNTVGIEITRGRHTAYLSLGSNIGDTNRHLSEAIEEIQNNPLCNVDKVSEFIVTKPIGGVEQDDFLNACIKITTLYTPHELLDFLHKIESEHHRERTIHWGPRTLDLDIILYDDIIMSDDDLIIPHPEAAVREFVLKPLCEIAPHVIHPTKKLTINELLSQFRQ
jgi:dihydroneopterin aldolase/2-amino-4-hydroxy-6-hydroxymethyldihydropteridine diphosphokinase